MVQFAPEDLFAAIAVVPQLSAIYCASSKISIKHKLFPQPHMYSRNKSHFLNISILRY